MIFAIVVCLYYSDPYWAKANGCSFPENGMMTFETAEECQSYASNNSSQNPSPDDSSITYRCVARTAPKWEFVDK